MAAADAKKAAALEQLKSVADREAKLHEEVFRLTDDLVSLGAELKSAHGAISALESQVKSKKHFIHWLCESEMDASKNSKPNVDVIGPVWKCWHWPKKNYPLLEPMLIWLRWKRSLQEKHWVGQSRIFKVRKNSKKRSSKMASFRTALDMKTAEMQSKNYT